MKEKVMPQNPVTGMNPVKIALFERLAHEVDDLLQYQKVPPLGRKITCSAEGGTPAAREALAFLVEEYYQVYGDLSDRGVEALDNQPWIMMLNGIIDEMHNLNQQALEEKDPGQCLANGTRKIQTLVLLSLDLYVASIEDKQKKESMEKALENIKNIQNRFSNEESSRAMFNFGLVPHLLIPDWYNNLQNNFIRNAG